MLFYNYTIYKLLIIPIITVIYKLYTTLTLTTKTRNLNSRLSIDTFIRSCILLKNKYTDLRRLSFFFKKKTLLSIYST